VAENRFIAKSKGNILQDSVNIFLSNGQVFEGWESVRIKKDINSISNQFSLNIDDRFEDGNKNWPLKPGEKVEIFIGKEKVITGYIETLRAGFSPGSRNFDVGGRSLPGDLVDCSVDGAQEFANIELKALAEQLVAPFGLKVFLSVTPKIIDKFAVKPSETVFEALNRAARLQGFFWVSTRAGNIRLTRTAKARAVTALVESENIISGSISINTSHRYSKIKVIGQSAGSDTFPGSNASEAEGSAKDGGITRSRPLTVIAEGSVTKEQAQDRAEWEAASRVAKGSDINISVQGWRQVDGSLWGINQVVAIDSKFLGIKRDMLISSVEHTQDQSGTFTNMSLVRKDSFDPKPEFKKNDDITSQIGAGPK